MIKIRSGTLFRDREFCRYEHKNSLKQVLELIGIRECYVAGGEQGTVSFEEYYLKHKNTHKYAYNNYGEKEIMKRIRRDMIPGRKIFRTHLRNFSYSEPRRPVVFTQTMCFLYDYIFNYVLGDPTLSNIFFKHILSTSNFCQCLHTVDSCVKHLIGFQYDFLLKSKLRYDPNSVKWKFIDESLMHFFRSSTTTSVMNSCNI